MLYFLGLVEIAVQIYLAIHAYRRGKTGWMYFIIFGPLVGSAAYFFAEWLPDFERSTMRGRSGQALDDIASDISRLANPTVHLERLKEELEFSDTFENRVALARECVRSGLYEEAIAMYESALTGVFTDDPAALSELAKTHFLNADFEQSRQIVENLRAIHPTYKRQEVGIFYARVLQEQGQDDEALEEYLELIRTTAGYEARCRCALLLKKNGRIAEANEHFNHIVSRSSQATRQYRRTQKQWIDIARQNLEGTEEP